MVHHDVCVCVDVGVGVGWRVLAPTAACDRHTTHTCEAAVHLCVRRTAAPSARLQAPCAACAALRVHACLRTPASHARRVWWEPVMEAAAALLLLARSMCT
jgi:hypothetical protein